MSSNREKQSQKGEACSDGGAAAGRWGGDGYDGEEVETDEAAQSERGGAPLWRWGWRLQGVRGTKRISNFTFSVQSAKRKQNWRNIFKWRPTISCTNII